MNKAWKVVFLLFIVCGANLAAADKPSAGTRAYLYQKETRAVLESRGWHVSRDEQGKLVANHPLGLAGAGSGGGQKFELVASTAPTNSPIRSFAWLTLTFQSATTAQTKCSASIVSYVYMEGASRPDNLKPHPFNNPETTKEIQGIMAAAESRLIRDHPEYAKK